MTLALRGRSNVIEPSSLPLVLTSRGSAYRSKFGLDVALEALQDALRSRRATVTEIWSAAKAGRVANVMRPYIEALTA